MKGNGRRNVWLVLGLVAMACLVLAGCPHNGLLEGGGGAGGIGGGSRGGGGGVQLVITNFVADGAASRSAWLGGPQRTIAPEHIDLTGTDRIDEYIFVAYGYGSGVYGPEIIDVSPNSGTAGLNIQGSGEWEITVEAYDWKKLVAAGGLNGTDKTQLINNHKDSPDDILDKKTEALVLSGSGLVDLGSGTQVTVTLTNDRVTADGTVDIAVKFATQADVTEIFKPKSTYVVTAELKNLVTQQGFVSGAGDTSTVTLYSNTPAVVDTDPLGAYSYDKYDPGTKQYTATQVSTQAGTTKVLRYNPKEVAVNTNDLKVPKGKYMLMVTVKNTADNSELYRGDWDFSVEGNRVTKGVFEIKELLGTKPKDPSGLEVSWEKPKTTDQLEGFNAIFAWGASDFHAVGYTLEIANVTRIYKYDGDTKVAAGGDRAFDSADALWTILDDANMVSADERAKLVTTLNWRTTPQAHLEIPRWMDGSLLGASTSIKLRLSTGNVYTARIRADNGTNSFSNWVYAGTPVTPALPPAPLGGPTKFDFAATNGIFDLLKFTYNLGGTDMWGLAADRNTTFEVDNGAGDTQVQGESLLQAEQYVPGTAAELEFSFEGDTVGAKQNDYVLTAVGDRKIVRSWLGWQNTKNGEGTLYGPANTTPPAGGIWTKADWKYEGYSDLVLIPVGAGGSSIKAKAETAGTFAVLDLTTIGFGKDTPNLTNSKVVNSLTPYTQGAQEGVYKNNAGDKLVLVMRRDTNQSPTTYTDLPFYVSVGNNTAGNVQDTLKDMNGDNIKVTDVRVTFMRGKTEYKYSSGFTPANTGAAPAYSSFSDATTNPLKGMHSGLYTLRIQITTGQGYTPEFQLPVYILYVDQAASTAAIP